MAIEGFSESRAPRVGREMDALTTDLKSEA